MTNYSCIGMCNWYYANISNDKSVMIFEVVMNETDISSKNSQSILHNDSLYLQVFVPSDLELCKIYKLYQEQIYDRIYVDTFFVEKGLLNL